MTIQAVPLPSLGSYSGQEFVMEAQGFTLDGRGIVVRVGYLDTSNVQRSASWLYDIAGKAYGLSINGALSAAFNQGVSDISLVETYAVQAYAASAQQYLAVLYSKPLSGPERLLALVRADGVVSSYDVLNDVLPDDGSVSISRFAISDDGRFVAVQTTADLLSDADRRAGQVDDNDADDVYLIDRQFNRVVRVSTVGGASPDKPNYLGDIAVSGGRVQVSFVSDYTFSASDANASASDTLGARDAYVWSDALESTGLKGTPTLTLVSTTGSATGGVLAPTQAGSSESLGPFITSKGIYFSTQTALGAGDSNQSPDVLVYANGLASALTWTGQSALDLGATVVSVSATGNIAAVLSASTAIAGEWGATQMLVTDTRSGASVTLPASPAGATNTVVSALLSPDGSYAALTSKLENGTPLVPGGPVPLDGALYLVATGMSSPLGASLSGQVKFWGTGSALPVLSARIGSQDVTVAGNALSATGVVDDDAVADGRSAMTLSKDAPQTALASSISLNDVLSALKVYLNKPITGNVNPSLRTIAADFNADGQVTLTDVLDLLKFYLNKPVVTKPKWVFVDTASYVPATVGEAWKPDATTGYWLNASGTKLSNTAATPAPIVKDLAGQTTDIQIVGVLRGDVDGSYSGN